MDGSRGSTSMEARASLRQLPSERSRAVARAKRTRTERDYLRAVVDAISTDDISDVVAEVLRQAKAGDKDARDWLGKYVLGGGKTPLAEVQREPLIRARRGR